MTPILQQHAKRVLDCSNKSSLFRSYATLWSTEANHSLQSRIKAAEDQKPQTVPVFYQWLQQGNKVKPSDMRGLIKNPCGSNRFFQALKASKWMGLEKLSTHFVEDYAARLHLAKTALGLEEVKKLFKSIPGNMRDYSVSVYSTLLTSYTRSDQTLDKAESTFKKKAKAREERYVNAISSLSKLDDVEGEEEGDDVRELDTKKSMMLLHVLNLVLLLLTLSLPFFVVPSNLIVPMVVLSVIFTHISITRLLRFIFF
ncbi:putative pentatricopeptide repeat-containing protein [Cardamine amara subsp. amara]|uniref:Pentatricopeptide repeat-containing protein n=1 Tax=Cardamine amara subsp. amara TaxID=228776 RepID=A0ABD1BGF9_CARAN